nr:gliding motility-associated C-terminal domain-containing protein [uncultured Fluviicola sp.]
MKSILIFLLFFYVFDSTGQCAGNIVVNGSFNSQEGEAVTAPGWTANSTPDVNNALGPLNSTVGYTWIGTPISSLDGGTWQNLYSPYEKIEQALTVTPGESYTLEFEYAAQGIVLTVNGSIIADPVAVNIYIDNALVAATPLDVTQYTWEHYSYTFIANSSPVILKLGPSDFSYIAIDGVCVPGSASDINPPTFIDQLEMPNIFTPDNDGINDFFYPKELTDIHQASLKIVNRWGNVVFETDDATIGWDGKINGENCSEGVYFWILNYSDTKNLPMHGFLQLIR